MCHCQPFWVLMNHSLTRRTIICHYEPRCAVTYHSAPPRTILRPHEPFITITVHAKSCRWASAASPSRPLNLCRACALSATEREGLGVHAGGATTTPANRNVMHVLGRRRWTETRPPLYVLHSSLFGSVRVGSVRFGSVRVVARDSG